MEIFDIIKYILGPLLITIIGYQQKQIYDVWDNLKHMITRTETIELLKDTIELSKEKIIDRVEPITDRLDRIEDKLDKFIEFQLKNRLE